MKNKINIKGFMMYIFFGILTTLLNLFIFYMLNKKNIDYKMTVTIANIISIFFSYITNKFFVFKNYNCKFKFLIKEIFKFFTSRLGTYFLDIFGMFICIEIFCIENFKSKIIINVIIIILNYILSKMYIFKE